MTSNEGILGRMNLLRRAAENFMSLAVIVVFAGLFAVPEAEQGDGGDAVRVGEQAS